MVSQPSELNYEVKRPRAKQSDIIHVKDIKRYQQPFDWEDKEVALEETVSYPKEERATAPSEVGATGPSSSDEPIEATIDQPETGKLSPEAPTRGGGEVEDKGARRSGRARKPPAWYGVMLVLTCLATVCAKPKESFMTEGVVFKHTATVGFSDSEWIILLDISMKPVLNALDEIETWMQRGASSINHAPPPDKATKQLLDSVTARAEQRVRVIELLRGRLKVLNDAIYSPTHRPRQKRGLLNAGGEILHLLFGTATDDALNALSKTVNVLGKETTDIVHTLEHQASLVNGTLWSLQAHTDLIKELNDAHGDLKKEVFDLNQRTMQEVRDVVSALCRIDELFGGVDRVINEIQQSVDKWAVTLATLANGRLAPEVLPPAKLSRLLHEIRDRLPNGWALTPVEALTFGGPTKKLSW